MNLLKKLSEKLNLSNSNTEKKSKIKRRLTKVAIASLVLAPVIAFAACTYTPSPNTPIDPDQPGITNPVDPDNPSTPTTDHSALLYDVLTNSYYRNIIDNFQEDMTIRNTQLYDPIPYGFLEDRGYNISDIKNDVLEADSVAYTKEDEPNNLYIATRVETDGTTPYYTCYTLRYSLSNLEMEDVKYLHRNRAIESPLFIQELSYQKNPTVISEASITINAYNNILNSLLDFDNVSSDLFGNKNITLDFVSFSTDNNTLICNVRNNHSNNFIADAEIRIANLVPGNTSVKITTLNNNPKVYTGPYLVTFSNNKEMQNYTNNTTPITYYDTQNIYQYNYGLYDVLINSNSL